MLERRPDRVEKLNRAFTGHGVSGSAVPKGIHAAIAISTDRRDTGSYGLKKRNPEPLSGTWHNEDIGSAVYVWELFITHPADKLHAVRDPKLQSEMLELFTTVSIACDHIDEIWILAKQVRHD